MAAKKTWFTKQQLLEYGFKDIIYDEAGNPIGCSKVSESRGLRYHIAQIIGTGTLYRYIKISFKHHGEDVNIQMPLHDYVWLMNDRILEEPLELDHKNTDSLDNRLDNLEPVTHQENLRRRRRNGVNQYSKYWTDEQWNQRQEELKNKRKNN